VLLQNFLEDSVTRFPDKVALIHKGERVTYREINERANRVAVLLQAQGIERGDRVAIFLDNSVESVISLFGILKADAVFLMLSPQLKTRKLIYILNDCKARGLIIHTDKLDIISGHFDSVPSVKCVVVVGDKGKIPKLDVPETLSWDEVENLRSPYALHPAPCALRLTPYSSAPAPSTLHPTPSGFTPAPCTLRPVPCGSAPAPCALSPAPPRNIDLDLATIIYTSGSMGDPKGVMLTHLNMMSAATSITTYLENVSEDVIIDVLPLSFDYGLYQVLMTFKFGGTIVLERSFAYPYEAIKQMVKERVTGFPGVPTIFAILLQMEDLGRYDLNCLRYITNTAAALPIEHIQKIRKVFPQAKLYSMYGLTECKRVSYLPPEELDRRPGSVGRGMPNEEVWIVDENGNRVGSGVVGELVVRGSNVMRGYWDDPETTDKALRPGPLPGEKVLYTGDLFKTDEEGFLYFVGRKDDMIKTRGERVSPKEVENAIYGLEGIGEVAVIPVADDILGQAIKAFVVPRNGFVLGEKDVLKHCKKELEELAIPKYVEFRDVLPKNPSGKIDKLALKQEVK
jgi:acyl-CoA synthetase (AMP-forming)/AMP-acid ligase II